MNYYEAREAKDGSGWHFTKMRDGEVWPVGYCRDHGPHPTPEDAERCWAGYLLDCRLRTDGMLTDEQRRCRECGGWTQRFASVDHGKPIPLCESHCTREFVERHWTAPTRIISSY